MREQTHTFWEQWGSATSAREPDQHDPHGSSKARGRRDPRLLRGWGQLGPGVDGMGTLGDHVPLPTPQPSTTRPRCHGQRVAHLGGEGEGFDPNSSAENEVMEKNMLF